MVRTCFVIFIMLPLMIIAQNDLVRNDSIRVTISGNQLRFPWAGGLNSALVSNIDLDGDGKKDIAVFDRTGKILTFISEGNAGSINYRYAPGYQQAFPQVFSWMLLADYNCDGKEDIFSYFTGGIRLHKNISTPGNPAFTLQASQIFSFQAPNNIPVYNSTVDLPAIADIDNDGDLDILNFGVSSTSVEYHENKSMDLYGHCDSLSFNLITECWGKFSEGSASHHISLNSCQKSSVNRHGGSTLLLIDQDNDGDKDLVIGDYGYKKLTFLRNGAVNQTAVMDSVIYNYPLNTPQPVDIFSAPAPTLADVNNDGIKDLIVSPFAPNQSENYSSMLLYLNTGTNTSPVFTFSKSRFLQEDMIDLGEGAYPVFFDYDQDGDDDLIVGNHGYFAGSGAYESRLSLFRNNGNDSQPDYEFITDDFAGLSSLGLSSLLPAFGDLDGDGDSDMIVGLEDGTLMYFENIAVAGNPANFSLVSVNYGGIDVGSNAAPLIADLDRDGLLDLLIGEKSGTLNYVKNTGSSTNAVFSQAGMVDQFGGVNVATPGWIFGFSTPALFELNGQYQMLVGSETGNIHYFTNIEGNLGGQFTRVTDNYRNIFEGTRSAPALSNVSQSGSGTLVIGNYRGGLGFYSGSVLVSVNEAPDIRVQLEVWPNPINDYLNVKAPVKGTLSLLDLSGRIISQNEMESSTGLRMEEFRPGIYLLFFRGTDGSFATEKIIVTR